MWGEGAQGEVAWLLTISALYLPQGAAYFQIWIKGTEAIFWTLDKGGRFGIQPYDPEVHIIRHFSWKVADLSKINIPAELCPAGFVGTALLLPPPSCPAGYAGPTCADVDECLLGTDRCSVNAACANTEGGYDCDCFEGFRGNGKVCVPTLSLHRIEKAYYTRDTLSCVSGSVDVPYPSNAPGYTVDPTDKFPAGYPGAHVAVTLLECKIACDMAELCTAFYYDPIQGACILKRNQCPTTDASIAGCDNCGRPVCDAPNVSICSKEVYTPNSPLAPTGECERCGRQQRWRRRAGLTPLFFFLLQRAPGSAPVVSPTSRRATSTRRTTRCATPPVATNEAAQTLAAATTPPTTLCTPHLGSRPKASHLRIEIPPLHDLSCCHRCLQSL